MRVKAKFKMDIEINNVIKYHPEKVMLALLKRVPE